MFITAKLQDLRIAPRKVRLVADLIRGKKVDESQAILNFTVKKANIPLLKLLNSAIANAKHNFQLEETNLYISKITVDEGRKLKRWRPRSRGQANEIQKKTSHITLILNEIEEGKKKKVIKNEKVKEIEKKESKKIKEKPKTEIKKEFKKPKVEKGLKRVFRRKAF